MSKTNGIWVSPTEFVQFGESRAAAPTLSQQIATRGRSIDFHALGGMYLPNPDPVLKALGKDIKVYKDLRSDAHVGGCIRRRKAAIKALERGVERAKAKTRVAKSIEAMLRDLDLERIINEMMDAVLYGYQPMEITWGKVGSFIAPVDVVGKPANWFVYGEDNQLRFRSRDNMLRGEELPERKFLVPRQDPTYDNPYGFPDLSMVFWPTTFKKGGLKFWVQFTEKYGSPWLIGKTPRSSTPKEVDLLLQRLQDMVQDAVAVIPSDESVDIHEAAGKAGSAEVYERLLTFCRSEVSIALLGQNQTTEAEANRASSQSGLEVTREIRDGDKTIPVAAINQLIRWTCELNWGDADVPLYELWEQEEVDKVLAERDERLTRAGARLTPQYFKRAYKLEDGDLVETAEPQPGQPGHPGQELLAAEFAEGEDLAPDQDALDAALQVLEDEGQAEADLPGLLLPVLKAVKDGRSAGELLGMLAELYPEMDAAGLQARLARSIFVADVWGRLHA